VALRDDVGDGVTTQIIESTWSSKTGDVGPLDNIPYGGIVSAQGYGETHAMHTVRDREKLVARVRRIRGQIEAVERAIVEEKGCYDVLQTVTAARGALNSLVAEMIEDHVRFHVLDPQEKVSPKRARAADELVDIVRAYVK
jgi:DNA-binding FrmR family transcriptional regulator